MEVDWAGSTAFIIDRDTGEKIKAYVFVANLPCSQFSYAEASLSMDSHSWITLHNHAYKYFGGTTQIVVPNNLPKNKRYEAYYTRTDIKSCL
ncbi:hypothetical protein [Ectobacillus sp. sgz5001026]|uniref:hypothetical protein n=1 Tax=Ectobacillus sp. sgz5001026 TaxID=3242473 RepID=UPI0036D3300E